MTIGSVTGGSSPSTELQVKLVKGQESQEEKVVSTILDSALKTAPITGKGGVLNVLA